MCFFLVLLMERKLFGVQSVQKQYLIWTKLRIVTPSISNLLVLVVTATAAAAVAVAQVLQVDLLLQKKLKLAPASIVMLLIPISIMAVLLWTSSQQICIVSKELPQSVVTDTILAVHYTEHKQAWQTMYPLYLSLSRTVRLPLLFCRHTLYIYTHDTHTLNNLNLNLNLSLNLLHNHFCSSRIGCFFFTTLLHVLLLFMCSIVIVTLSASELLRASPVSMGSPMSFFFVLFVCLFVCFCFCFPLSDYLHLQCHVLPRI